MTLLYVALLLVLSTIAEATINLGDEPIDRANLDPDQSKIVWFAYADETQTVISVATKFEIYQKGVGPVHIGLWIRTIYGYMYVNGHEFDLPTAGYHSIDLSVEQRFLVGLPGVWRTSIITVQNNNVASTVPYDSVSCTGREKALKRTAISLNNLNPYNWMMAGMAEENDCRAYSANIVLEPACAPGHYSSNKVAPCQQCMTNQYQENYGETECQRCPSGHITDGPGSDSADDCYECTRTSRPLHNYPDLYRGNIIFVDFTFQCNGLLTGVDLYVKRSGTVYFTAWRPSASGTSWSLIGITKAIVVEGGETGLVEYRLDVEDRFQVRGSDVFGIVYPAGSSAIITSENIKQRHRDDTSSRFIRTRDTRENLYIGISKSGLAGNGGTERIAPINPILE